MKYIDIDKGPETLSAFVYGLTRSGKTHLAASFPRPVFLSSLNENGFTTITYMDHNRWFDPNVKPVVWGIEGAKDMNEALTKLEGGLIRNFQSLIWDSMGYYIDPYLVEATKRSREYRISKNLGADADTRAVYGELDQHLNFLATRIFALPVNKVILAHEAPPTMDEPVGGPMIPGKNKFKFAGRCDLVARAIRVGDPEKPDAAPEFALETAHAKHGIGGRFGTKLPRLIKDPSYKLIMDYISGRRVNEDLLVQAEKAVAGAEAAAAAAPARVTPGRKLVVRAK
jgi:hypothetical protein